MAESSATTVWEGALASEVTGTVPGLDQAGFEAVIDEAHRLCLISGALRGNVEMTVDAKLAEEPGIL